MYCCYNPLIAAAKTPEKEASTRANESSSSGVERLSSSEAQDKRKGWTHSPNSDKPLSPPPLQFQLKIKKEAEIM